MIQQQRSQIISVTEMMGFRLSAVPHGKLHISLTGCICIQFHWKSIELIEVIAILSTAVNSDKLWRSPMESDEVQCSPVQSGELRFCRVWERAQTPCSNWRLSKILNNHIVLCCCCFWHWSEAPFSNCTSFRSGTNHWNSYLYCFVALDSAAGPLFRLNML